MAEREKDPFHGVAEPSALRDRLDALDAAILELMAVRTRLLKEVEDAFTGLRSSAQLLREIFFGVPLPVDSPKELIERAGGPLRIIRISYKETGAKAFALTDVIDAIPKFDSVFPIRSFEELADQLEKIREDGPDTGPTWFAKDISTRHLQPALENEARMLASGDKRISSLTHV